MITLLQNLSVEGRQKSNYFASEMTQGNLFYSKYHTAFPRQMIFLLL